MKPMILPGGTGMAMVTLDLVVGNNGQNYVYENIGGYLKKAWSADGEKDSAEDDTRSVAWGDWDGDGDLDLAVGNWSKPNRVYINSIEGGLRELVLDWSSPQSENTNSVAWEDWDGDGNIDLVVGNSKNQSYL